MKRALILFFTVLLIGLAIDLGTKELAFSYLGMPGEYDNQLVTPADNETDNSAAKAEKANNTAVDEQWWNKDLRLRSAKWVVNGLAGFQTTLNEGALFGMGQGNVPVFAAFSFVALIGIFCWVVFFDAWKSTFLTFLLGMICAGILGNLYDRLGLPGLKWNYADEYHELGAPVYAVRDWILVMIGKNPWPNFNIADSYLVCGAILLAAFSFFSKNPVPDTSKNSSPESKNPS
ncbi:MAG: signal peptidase II [Thermoguttaceae bacterium]